MRWGDTVYLAELLCRPLGITLGGRPKGDKSRWTIGELQASMLPGLDKKVFPFTTLPRKLQIRVVEMLSYGDLKVLE